MNAIHILALTAAISGTPDANTAMEIRSAIERSVPYIENKGVYWIERKKCASCHRVGTMTWGLGLARAKGIKVSAKLDEWYGWAVDYQLQPNPKRKEVLVASGNLEGVVQLLLARGLFDRKKQHAETYKKLFEILKTSQNENGAWNAGGQLPGQKRPKNETRDVSTMWIIYGLLEFDPDSHQSPTVQKSLKLINNSKPGKSIEWYAANLILANILDDQDKQSMMVKMLINRQQDDGGWGWLVDDPSDAFGTSMALYALQKCQPDANEAIDSAIQFLLNTQTENGSWKVNGTKESRKTKVQETSTYWGITWAAIALAASLE